MTEDELAKRRAQPKKVDRKTRGTTQRHRDIDTAIRIAKQRTDWTCALCGTRAVPLIGSHLFPGRRSGHPGNDPRDPDLIVPLCVLHDREFDALPTTAQRLDWLQRHPALKAWADRFKAALEPPDRR